MTLMPYPKLRKAVAWAFQLHDGQWRDGDHPLPYITHPIEVMANLRYIGGVQEEEDLCAAVLHDTIEMNLTSENEIKQRFNQTVADLVVEMTRTEPTIQQLQGLDKNQIWCLRAKMLVEEIKKMSTRCQRIKLADRLSNLKGAYQTKKNQKLQRYLWQTQRILDVIKKQTCPKLWNAIHEELPKQKISDPCQEKNK